MATVRRRVDLPDLFRKISRELEAKFEQITAISHPGLKGTKCENILCEFLINEGRIPGRFRVCTGEIVTPFGQKSKQIDIIIYDSNAILFVNEQNFKTVPIEFVAGTIEVKARLDKRSLNEALENIKSFRDLKAYDYDQNQKKIQHKSTEITSMIFAFNSTISLEKVREHYLKVVPQNHDYRAPDLIAVHRKGVIDTRHHYFKFNPHFLLNNPKMIPTLLNSVEDSLFHFYYLLLGLCSSWRPKHFKISEYLQYHEILDDHVIRDHTHLGKNSNLKINSNFIKAVYDWCNNHEKLSIIELQEKTFGHSFVRPDMEAEDFILEKRCHLYNPDGLPPGTGDRNIIDYEKFDEATLPFKCISIDLENYDIPWYYLRDNLEEM